MIDGYNSLSQEQALQYKYRDALHILSLENIPLETPGLRHATLIKNAKLETVVEVFKGRQMGSGQIRIDALPKAFPSYQKQLESDIPTLQSLSRLSSFDVYSLRIDFRHMGLNVDKDKQLSLSPVKKRELTDAMRKFTRPLIQRVYGSTDASINDMSDITKLLTNPNRDEAIKNLRMMSERLKVKMDEIPAFIEEYGDIFLSLAYYQRGFEEVLPSAEVYIGNIKNARTNYNIKSDKETLRILDYIENTLKQIISSFTARLETFQEKFKGVWDSIDIYSFQEIKRLITSNHRSLGGVLCGLAVKMHLWEERFPNGTASTSQLKEFSRSDMYQGLEDIRYMESNAAQQLRKT